MKSTKFKIGLFSIIILFLLFAFGRAIWNVEADRLPARIEATFTDKGQSTNTFTNEYLGEIRTIRNLAYTCLEVAECTPAQSKNAIELAKLDQRKLYAFLTFEIVKKQAIEAYQAASTNPTAETVKAFTDLEPIYIKAKGTIIGMARESDERSKGPLPKKLRSSFEDLQ